jgi:hypothetical protein
MDRIKSLLFLTFLALQNTASSAFQVQPIGLVRNKNRQLTTTTTLKASKDDMPVLEEWKVLEDGRIEGVVQQHPNYEDGSTISTSPPINDLTKDTKKEMVVETSNGSQYLLRNPASTKGINLPSFFPSQSKEVMNVEGDMETPKEEEMSETKKLMQQVKDAGIAGVISYAVWELGFWTVSVPVCILGYRQVTGHWPDFSNQDDVKQLSVEAFAFVNFARFAVPLRISLALGTTPWIKDNIVDRFLNNNNNNNKNDGDDEQ